MNKPGGAALWMLAVLSVANAGCSLIYTKGPQPEVQPPPPCTTSVAAPVVDTVLAAASLGLVVAGVVGATKPPAQGFAPNFEAMDAAAIVTGLVMSTVLIPSAIVGFNRTAACRASLEAKPQLPASPSPPQSSLLLVPPRGCPPPGDAPRICASAVSFRPSALVLNGTLH